MRGHVEAAEFDRHRERHSRLELDSMNGVNLMSGSVSLSIEAVIPGRSRASPCCFRFRSARPSQSPDCSTPSPDSRQRHVLARRISFRVGLEDGFLDQSGFRHGTPWLEWRRHSPERQSACRCACAAHSATGWHRNSSEVALKCLRFIIESRQFGPNILRLSKRVLMCQSGGRPEHRDRFSSTENGVAYPFVRQRCQSHLGRLNLPLDILRLPSQFCLRRRIYRGESYWRERPEGLADRR